MKLTHLFINVVSDTKTYQYADNRDIFDCWFFMHKHTPINKAIIESRMNMLLADYLQKCIEKLESMSDKGLLNGLGELMDRPLMDVQNLKGTSN